MTNKDIQHKVEWENMNNAILCERQMLNTGKKTDFKEISTVRVSDFFKDWWNE